VYLLVFVLVFFCQAVGGHETDGWAKWRLALPCFYTQRKQTAAKGFPTFKVKVRHYGQLCRSCIPNLSCDHFK